MPDYVEPCCPMPINKWGEGPEMDPRKVIRTKCMTHMDQDWPCTQSPPRCPGGLNDGCDCCMRVIVGEKPCRCTVCPISGAYQKSDARPA